MDDVWRQTLAQRDDRYLLLLFAVLTVYVLKHLQNTMLWHAAGVPPVIASRSHFTCCHHPASCNRSVLLCDRRLSFIVPIQNSVWKLCHMLSVPAQRGAASSQRLVVIASTHFCAAANARATASQIYRPSTNCWKTLTTDSSINSVVTLDTTAYYFFHYLIWYHNITISVPPHLTIDNYRVRFLGFFSLDKER